MSATKNLSVFRRLLCAMLSLMLTASLLVTGMLAMTAMLLQNAAIHERVALNDRVIDAQMQRIAEDVTALSELYSFEPAPILEMIDRESVISLNRETIAWWMAMAGGSLTEQPAWQGGDVEAAIRSDERFLENVPTGLQKATARDKITPRIHAVISEAVLPIRSALVTFAASAVLERLPMARIALLLSVAPWAMLAVSLLLEGIILLLCRKHPRSQALWGTSPLAACALVITCVAVLLVLLDVPGRVGVMSPFAALQAEGLMQQLYLHMLSAAGVCLLVSVVWMCFAGRKAARMAKERLAT